MSMFVVVTFNQASHRPELESTEVFDTEHEARLTAGLAAEVTADCGRREQHRVYRLEEL